MKKPNIPNEALPYIECHRTELVGIEEFIEDIRRDFQILSMFLPKTGIKTILDIGAGLGVIDWYLKQKYPKAEVTLLDSDGSPSTTFGFNETYAPYTSRKIAEQIVGEVKWLDVGTKELLEYDLVMSFLSCGYHYPIDTYNTKYKYLVIDVRNETCDLEERFPDYKILKIGSDYTRIFYAR